MSFWTKLSIAVVLMPCLNIGAFGPTTYNLAVLVFNLGALLLNLHLDERR